MNTVAEVELECSYGAGDGRTRSRVASMPKERSGRSRLDWRSDWEKHGYDNIHMHTQPICALPAAVWLIWGLFCTLTR